MKRTTKIALCGLFSALGTVAFVIEGLFPPLFIPGAKLGVSNVFILLATIILGGGYGFCALIIKITLGSLFSGNISGILYSLPAGLISLSVEYLLLRFAKKISLPGVSVCGAVINSAVQNLVFCLITNTLSYLIYLPYLALIAVLSGLTVGFTVYLIIKVFRSYLDKGGEDNAKNI